MIRGSLVQVRETPSVSHRCERQSYFHCRGVTKLIYIVLPVRIHDRHAAPTPTRLAEVISDDFPILHWITTSQVRGKWSDTFVCVITGFPIRNILTKQIIKRCVRQGTRDCRDA